MEAEQGSDPRQMEITYEKARVVKFLGPRVDIGGCYTLRLLLKDD